MKFDFLVTYFVIVAVVLVSIWVGFSLGKYNRRFRKNVKNISLGSINGAMLALLGFILALTLSMVSSRYAARKQLVLDEANALGTAILRTDFLEEPLRAESRKLLIEYVDIRSQFAEVDRGDIDKVPKLVPKLMADSETLHNELWTQLNKASNQAKDTESFALYVQSLNEVIDLHSKRYNQGIQYRLSRSIWFLLYFVTILAMLAVGYEFGISDSGSFLGALLLALMFSAIVFAISDLDQPGPNSLIKVSQQPMVDLQRQLKSPSK